MLFDFGDPVASVVECCAAAGGREDQFGPSVGGVRPAFHIPELLQVVDQFGGGGEAQLGAGGELGQPDAVDAEVAEDLQVRHLQVGITAVGCGLEQLGPEVPQQPSQRLPDGEPGRSGCRASARLSPAYASDSGIGGPTTRSP